ncbi:MAG: hypothetical protein PUB39_06940 [Eubacteriales bacterium]|nr:hypothetical protein [Eubacteriales bacterium]
MIVAVDFDGCLAAKEKGKLVPNMGLIQNLKRNQASGNTVILWTCREGRSLMEALAFLRSYGFIPNFVNCNCPEGLKKLGHDSRKIYADIYLDDKGVKV